MYLVLYGIVLVLYIMFVGGYVESIIIMLMVRDESCFIGLFFIMGNLCVVSVMLLLMLVLWVLVFRLVLLL